MEEAISKLKAATQHEIALSMLNRYQWLFALMNWIIMTACYLAILHSL